METFNWDHVLRIYQMGLGSTCGQTAACMKGSGVKGRTQERVRFHGHREKPMKGILKPGLCIDSAYTLGWMVPLTSAIGR